MANGVLMTKGSNSDYPNLVNGQTPLNLALQPEQGVLAPQELKKLKHNDEELTAKLVDIEKEYKEVYKVAEDWLRHIYMTCKRQFVVWRYGNLKDMMKECIEFLAHPDRYGNAPIPKIIIESSEKQFDYKDIEDLKTKEEVENDIEHKLKWKEELEKKIRRLKELGMKYQYSKRYYPYKRYEELKSVIKEIIRD